MWLEWLYFLVIVTGSCYGAPEGDRILSLPNLKFTPTFKQYSGYLPVTNGNFLFYWLTMAPKNPQTAPTVLYLNGGPGCSSLQGLLVEMGPFRVLNYGAQVVENIYAWNRFANVIYLDAPAGVGFSINIKQNYTFTDAQVAIDNHEALRAFFQVKFPELKGNDFFIGGESYAGYYVPMLASRLIQDPFFTNFKGYFVGNGCLNDRLLVNSAVVFNYNHALTDETTYRQAIAKCCPSPSADTCDWYSFVNNETSPCYDDANTLYMSNYYAGYDPYFLYFSCYLDQPDGINPYPSRISQGRSNSASAMQDHLIRRFVKPSQRDKIPRAADAPACSHYDDMTTYLNRIDVRNAIHVPGNVQKYSTCSQEVEENYITQIDDVSPYVKQGLAAKLRIMFFNGDVDSVCNVVHNSQFMANLNLSLVQSATPWNFDEDLPPSSGLWTIYDGLDFLTVRGGGHFPASSAQKPRESLQMFYNYLQGQNYSTPIPTTSTTSTRLSVKKQKHRMHGF